MFPALLFQPSQRPVFFLTQRRKDHKDYPLSPPQLRAPLRLCVRQKSPNTFLACKGAKSRKDYPLLPPQLRATLRLCVRQKVSEYFSCTQRRKVSQRLSFITTTTSRTFAALREAKSLRIHFLHAKAQSLAKGIPLSPPQLCATLRLCVRQKVPEYISCTQRRKGRKGYPLLPPQLRAPLRLCVRQKVSEYFSCMQRCKVSQRVSHYRHHNFAQLCGFA